MAKELEEVEQADHHHIHAGTWNSLPTEIKDYIFDYLNIVDAAKALRSHRVFVKPAQRLFKLYGYCRHAPNPRLTCGRDLLTYIRKQHTDLKLILAHYSGDNLQTLIKSLNGEKEFSQFIIWAAEYHQQFKNLESLNANSPFYDICVGSEPKLFKSTWDAVKQRLQHILPLMVCVTNNTYRFKQIPPLSPLSPIWKSERDLKKDELTLRRRMRSNLAKLVALDKAFPETFLNEELARLENITSTNTAK